MKKFWFILTLFFLLAACTTEPTHFAEQEGELIEVASVNTVDTDVVNKDNYEALMKDATVSVRKIQIQTEMEPPKQPDVYTYDTLYGVTKVKQIHIGGGRNYIKDIWQRVRVGYQFKTKINDRIKAQIAYYKPSMVERITKRSEPYIHFILEEVNKRNLPTELALLPIVESAFKSNVFSPKAAAGLWQFIPSTGRLYGLKQNGWYDGRLDPYASTLAALDYLEYLNKYFDGDWLKALASYNAGPGRINKAVKANEKKGKPTDYWSLDLPKETMYYVPRLLAAAEIIKNPHKYNVTLPNIENKPYLSRVPVNFSVDLTQVAKLADMDWEDFHALNAGFKQSLTDPLSINYIILPRDRLASVNFNAAKSAPHHLKRVEAVALTNEYSLYSPTTKKKVPDLISYRVRSGDNLYKIAHKYNTNASTLMKLNGLKSSNLAIGQKILVPNPKAKKTVKTSGITKTLKYKVKTGDTLWSIAKYYKVGVNDLKSWNNLKTADIKNGQKLLVKVNGS